MRISDVSSDVCSSDLTSNGTFQLHSIQVGALAFTPGNNKQDGVREGDRPYASLLYVANGRSYVRDAGRTVYHTSLSVGLLGTQIVPEFQDAFHSAIGANKPKGWDHQISDSGEPTIRSEEHTSELQSLMRISYAVFCLKKKKENKKNNTTTYQTTTRSTQ